MTGAANGAVIADLYVRFMSALCEVRVAQTLVFYVMLYRSF
jgi:hypothetical protein